MTAPEPTPRRRRRHQPGEPVNDIHAYARTGMSLADIQAALTHTDTGSLGDLIARLRPELWVRAERWLAEADEAMGAEDWPAARLRLQLAADQALELAALLPDERDRPITLVH